MAAILYLIFLAILSLVIWRMWMTGQISGVAPKTRKEKIQLFFGIIGAVNFIAFLAHMGIDGTSAFPSGGRLVDGHYLVPNHGKEVSFTPIRYQLSYVHGVIALVVHIVCMVALWKLDGKKKEV